MMRHKTFHKYEIAPKKVKCGVKTALPKCDVSNNYRQQIIHILEEAYAGLTWLA